jgi:hypothetical protein
MVANTDIAKQMVRSALLPSLTLTHIFILRLSKASSSSLSSLVKPPTDALIFYRHVVELNTFQRLSYPHRIRLSRVPHRTVPPSLYVVTPSVPSSPRICYNIFQVSQRLSSSSALNPPSPSFTHRLTTTTIHIEPETAISRIRTPPSPKPTHASHIIPPPLLRPPPIAQKPTFPLPTNALNSICFSVSYPCFSGSWIGS